MDDSVQKRTETRNRFQVLCIRILVGSLVPAALTFGTMAVAQERAELDTLRAEKLARERRHIMNCDNGHLGKYPNALQPGDPVDPRKLLAWRFLGHEQTQVDAISLSTTAGGLGRYTHRTEVGEVVQDETPTSSTSPTTWRESGARVSTCRRASGTSRSSA